MSTLLITGGGRGIGAATARAAAVAGWDVAISYRTDQAAAASVVAACQALGRRAVAVAADVSVEDDVRRLFSTVDETLGQLGGLVNNAGITAPAARVESFSAARIERMMAVNVVGPFLCAREAVARLSTRHGGSGGAIVNVSSRAATFGSPGEYVDYAASKAALDVLTLGLGAEVAAEGIRVNSVRPGLVHTQIHATTGDPDRVDRLAATIPLGRGGEPEEVAAAVVWLLSPEATYVTRAILDVSGGR